MNNKSNSKLLNRFLCTHTIPGSAAQYLYWLSHHVLLISNNNSTPPPPPKKKDKPKTKTKKAQLFISVSSQHALESRYMMAQRWMCWIQRCLTLSVWFRCWQVNDRHLNFVSLKWQHTGTGSLLVPFGAGQSQGHHTRLRNLGVITGTHNLSTFPHWQRTDMWNRHIPFDSTGHKPALTIWHSTRHCHAQDHNGWGLWRNCCRRCLQAVHTVHYSSGVLQLPAACAGTTLAPAFGCWLLRCLPGN